VVNGEGLELPEGKDLSRSLQPARAELELQASTFCFCLSSAPTHLSVTPHRPSPRVPQQAWEEAVLGWCFCTLSCPFLSCLVDSLSSVDLRVRPNLCPSPSVSCTGPGCRAGFQEGRCTPRGRETRSGGLGGSMGGLSACWF
jgi:hypothetical protein